MSEYIDRDLALSHPYANGKYDKVHANIAYITGFESYKEWLETLPKADVRENIKGEWIIYGYPSNEQVKNCTEYYYCSQCNSVVSRYESYLFKFCPNCGADMRGE